MANVSVEYEDQDSVLVRMEDRGQFIGLATDGLVIDFEDRGVEGGCVSVVELSLSSTIARVLFLALAEALTEKDCKCPT